MKIVNSSFSLMYDENPQKHIERIARNCYKSEDKISSDSHKRMCINLYKNKHWAMLEHFIFIYKVNKVTEFKSAFVDILNSEKYINTTEQFINDERRTIVSFNARSLLDLLNKYKDYDQVFHDIVMLIEKVVYDYDCDEIFGNRFKKVNHDNFAKIDMSDISMLTPIEQFIHGWESVKFICDRGVSHEIVRHRDASFAQESTRYCCYNKDKFGNEITTIKPYMFNEEAEPESNERIKYLCWERAMEFSEQSYFELLNLGCTAQEARSVLNNSLKTEIVMTAKLSEWYHFFELRCDKAAHPQIRELAIPLYNTFLEKYKDVIHNNVLDDIEKE